MKNQQNKACILLPNMKGIKEYYDMLDILIDLIRPQNMIRNVTYNSFHNTYDKYKTLKSAKFNHPLTSQHFGVVCIPSTLHHSVMPDHCSRN